MKKLTIAFLLISGPIWGTPLYPEPRNLNTLQSDNPINLLRMGFVYWAFHDYFSGNKHKIITLDIPEGPNPKGTTPAALTPDVATWVAVGTGMIAIGIRKVKA